MANSDWITAKGGLLPVGYPYGNARINYYRLTTDATASIFIGAPMDLDANGRCVRAGTGADLGIILGPALGFLDTSKAGLPSAMTALDKGAYLPANTDAFVAIADDPQQLFTIQGDTSGTITEADIGGTCRFTIRGTVGGSTVTGHSSAELLSSDVAGDTGGSLRLVALADNVNEDGTLNTASANYTKWVVKIQSHRLSGTSNPSTAI